MKKRLMAALLCLCLLMGTMMTAWAEESGGDGSSTASSPAGGAITADNLDSTTGDGYEDFDTTADVAYSQSIDIYAQAIDAAIPNTASVYKVEIVWGDMAWAWGATAEITNTWLPASHSYDNDEATRTKTWYLIDDSALTTLEYNTDNTYDSILEGTAQNWVLLFNHSNAAVNANVKLTEVNAGTEDDNITATLALDNTFGTAAGTTAVENTTEGEGGYDFKLSYDSETGVIYSKTNGTAGAVTVNLSGEPTDGALNESNNTTVAKITVKLTLPVAAESSDDGDAQQ